MSLNDIQLSDITCQMLFEKNLVAKVEMAEQQPVSEKVTISSLGENKKNIVFLVNNPEHK